MSPEKEKRLLEKAREYEALAQKAAELREKRDKLRAAMNDVQKQLEAASNEASRVEQDMFHIVAEGLPTIRDPFEKGLTGNNQAVFHPDIFVTGGSGRSILDTAAQNMGASIGLGNPVRRL